MARRRIDRSGIGLAAFLIALLAILGVLQHRWLGALSHAEQARIAAGLEAGAVAVARNIDYFLTHAGVAFVATQTRRIEDHATAGLARFRTLTEAPDLLRAVWSVRDEGYGALVSARFDEEAGRFVTAALPAGLGQDPVSAGRHGRLRSRRRPFVLAPGLRDRPPAIVVPRFDDRSRQVPFAVLVLEIDMEVLTQQLLPQLVERYLPAIGGVDLAVCIQRVDDGSMIFTSGPMVDDSPPDSAVPLFRLGGEGARADRPRGAQRRRNVIGGVSGRMAPWWDRLAQGDLPRWRLVVNHPAGSLETFVSAARRRNLVLVFAVLAVLASSVVILVVGARRAQALARQRLALVAAVSHELRTPLAAVRVAGANLHDGVVVEPDQVRSYGELIEREGRRLSRLVEQTLALSGAAAGSSLDRRPLALAPLVEGVMAQRRADARAAGMLLELELEERLPLVLGDRDALARAVDNPIENAIRHAAGGGRVDVSVHAASAGTGDLLIDIADRGPGIPTAERRQLFEPFFRGAKARGATPGTGLGLAVVDAIVRAHDGRIEVLPRVGGGTIFRIVLPTVSPAAEAFESPGTFEESSSGESGI